MAKPNTRLKQARHLRGWSQARVAMALGTDAASVSRWERGVSFPYPYFRERLCQLFEMDAEKLGLLPEHPPEPQQAEAPARNTDDSRPLQLDSALPISVSSAFIGRELLFAQLKRELSDSAKGLCVSLWSR